VFQGGVGCKDRVVGLYNSSGHLGCGIDSELQFRLLAVVNGESLHEERSETRTGATTERVEDEESLEACALVSEFADAVEDQVYDFLSNGVVTTSIVVCGILLTSDKLFWMKQLSVCASADLVNYSGFKIDEDGTGNVLASSGLAEERVEGVVSTPDGLVSWHLTIRLDAVLKAIQLPAGISDLDSGLANVYRDALTHFVLSFFELKCR